MNGRTISIRSHLILVAASVVFVAGSLLTWSGVRQVRKATEVAEADSQRLATFVSGDVASLVERMEDVLDGLESSAVAALTGAETCERWEVETTLMPPNTNAGVLDLTGGTVCTYYTDDRPRPAFHYEDRAWFQEALIAEGTVLSQPLIARTTGLWTVSMAKATRDEYGEVRGIQVLGIQLATLQEHLHHTGLPANFVMTILDDSSTIVATSAVGSEKWVGTRIESAGEALAEFPESGVTLGTSVLSGEEMMYGYHDVPGTTWTVFVGVPTKDVLASVRSSMMTSGLLALGGSSLILLLVGLGYRRVVTPLGRLGDATRAAVLGEIDHIDYEGPAEFVAVAVSFDEALDQKRDAESRRQESEGRFRRMVDASPDGIVMVDANGNITLMNEQAVAQFGFTRDELIGRPLEILIPPRYRAGHPQLRDEYAADAHPRLIGDCSGLYARRKDGTEFPAEIGLNPMETREGPMVMATVRDITRRRDAEEAARHLERQLSQAAKMEAIGQLAGGMAHDFNNLLTVIRGRTELVRERLESPDLRSDLDQVSQAADHAASLTHQLLAFGRQQVLKPSVIDLGSVVTDLDGMMRRLIPENIELITTLAARLARVRVDPTQMEQVILNLAINARDAMPDGGTITIDVRNVEVTEDFALENVGANVGSHVLMSVHDTGTGMDAETQSRIFEPFFTTKGSSGGTGLGLATVYGIINQSRGYIRVRSQEGQGTTFELYFPQTDAAPETSPGQGVERLPRRTERPATVLVVEDDPAVRALTRDFLVSAGHHVLESEDGPAAIRICEELDETLDLLITDVVMPNMSGPELAKHLTSIRPNLKTLFVSGYVDESLRSHLADMPGAPFLPKPFTLEELCAKVEEIHSGE